MGVALEVSKINSPNRSFTGLPLGASVGCVIF